MVCHGLAEARGDATQDDVDQLVVSHLSIAIESIEIVQVLLNNTYLVEITDVVKSPIRLVVVSIILPNGILHLLPGVRSLLVRIPLF